MSNDVSTKSTINLSEFIKLKTTGDIPINDFVEIICQYLEADFKFDYITRCESRNSPMVTPDLVIHKADLVILLTGNQIMQLYESLSKALPLSALLHIRTVVDDCIFNMFHISQSILNLLETNVNSDIGSSSDDR